MKILMIMPGFFPGKKYGGPPVSIDNFCSLMIGHEKYIITSYYKDCAKSNIITVLAPKN